MKRILNLGMGVDSVAIFLELERRGELGTIDAVVTSMTGDEFGETGRLMRQHILPRMRKHGVRFVQVARTSDRKGEYEVLSDTTNPTELHLEGRYKLSDQLRKNGIVPQMNNHLCSMKTKAYVIDQWIDDTFPTDSRTEIFGFAKGEESRARKAEKYADGIVQMFGYAKGEESRARKAEGQDRYQAGKQRFVSFPLLDWGWDREHCERFIESIVGEPWRKSCCEYCPFSYKTWEKTYHENPKAGAFATWIEHLALAMNPTQKLNATKGVRETLERDGNDEALRIFEERLTSAPHALYRVRRIIKGSFRSVETVKTGSRDEMLSALATLGEIEIAAGIERVYRMKRVKGADDEAEEFFVVAPSEIQDKARKSFEAKWAQIRKAPQAQVQAA